jgi:hypothetical protein
MRQGGHEQRIILRQLCRAQNHCLTDRCGHRPNFRLFIQLLCYKILLPSPSPQSLGEVICMLFKDFLWFYP